MKTRLDEQTIALRVAREFEDGMVINLGYGMPGLCANLIPEDRKVYFHSENGVLGYGGLGVDEEKDYELINASDQPVTRMHGMCFFDSAASFDMIRGGHVDLVVLGAYQVSQKGDLANWGRPGRPATGMGGGMDLAVGCRQVIVMMLHTTKEGAARIVNQCSFPANCAELCPQSIHGRCGDRCNKARTRPQGSCTRLDRGRSAGAYRSAAHRSG